MKIFLASDHAGFELKGKIAEFLKSQNYEVEDVGPHQLNPDDDYPLLIQPAATKVAENSESRGIIFGHSGQGEAIVANKVPGIRAVVYYGGGNKDIIHLSREHNNANILSIGAHFVEFEEAKDSINHWLNREFKEEDRHLRRINEIKEIEEKW